MAADNFETVSQKVRNGSPNKVIDRTFHVHFRFPQISKSRRSGIYRNPVVLAEELRQKLLDGEFKSQAHIAQKLGYSRARITQIIQLLKLSPSVLNMIRELGDPLSSQLVTERLLRPLTKQSTEEQDEAVHKLLERSQSRAKKQG